MIVQRPSGEESGYEVAHLLTQGSVGAEPHAFPFDIEDIERLRRETEEKLARKRPCGFTAVWDEPPVKLRRAA